MVKKDENYTVQTTLRMTQSMYDEIMNISDETGITAMEWIRRACREKLEREKDDARNDSQFVTQEQLAQILAQNGIPMSPQSGIQVKQSGTRNKMNLKN